MASKQSKPKRPAVQLKNPVLLGHADLGNNGWTLGASFLDDRSGYVPWWFKEDAQGYTSHTSAESVLRALHYWGMEARIKKDMYPLIEVEKADTNLGGGWLQPLDKEEERRTMELIEKSKVHERAYDALHGPRSSRLNAGREPGSVPVRPYVQRRYVKDRFGDRVYVGRWPSDKGFDRLRRHYKRMHPRAFRASVRKGVATRKRNAREN